MTNVRNYFNYLGSKVCKDSLRTLINVRLISEAVNYNINRPSELNLLIFFFFIWNCGLNKYLTQNTDTFLFT